MEKVKIGMFMTLGIAVLAIYFGDFIRNKLPVLKKYCLPSSVVGGTIFALISLALYKANVYELSYDSSTVNSLFYCLFFAASGSAASLALLKKGGKLVVIFAILAAVLAFLQNVISVGIGLLMKVNPMIALMTGSTPMTGGHGNAASFSPTAIQAVNDLLAKATNIDASTASEIVARVAPASEVALAAATFGLIAGCIFGGPFGNFMVKKHKLEDPELDGKETAAVSSGEEVGTPIYKHEVIRAVLMLCVACGFGQGMFMLLKYFNLTLPIHVCCMLGGIIVRLILDRKKDTKESLYEALDTVGDFSLALFVSISIITMKLWQLQGLGLAMVVMLMAQVVFILIFCYFLTFKLLGKNYDSAVMAVGHVGFGLGAVPVSMTTMQTVCQKYRYSKLAFFVVPVIGGFISNLSNAVIISGFINYCGKLIVEKGIF
ncbi:sodium/glutamate symporter [Fusobacterium sp. PH5-44]|uniref:sodium/glutamate symporter n=1 Tax=unclassified Fusobacterium TaxID=2648384 RepID=UPI003D23F59D